MEDIFELIENLSLDEKAQVVGRLVGKHSGLSVIQSEINLMPNKELSDVLNAIAVKIRNG